MFHSTGDCGSTSGPTTQNEVTDKMVADFAETDPREVPQFAFLLGDIVYNFGETEYYYDQFYEPYRNYQAPVLAAAGNHDGMISPLAHATSLAAYLRNFCADPAHGFTVMPEAGGLSRTAQIQPGVFFTFDAPFVRILVFYSNTLEDPGVIANSTIGNSQLDYLKTALTRVKTENYAGACFSRIIIRLTRSAASIPPASRCASRWMRSAKRWACGRMRCSRAMRTTISATRVSAPTAPNSLSRLRQWRPQCAEAESAGRRRLARAANASAGDRHGRCGDVRELRRYGLRLSARHRHRGAIADRISSGERRPAAKTPDDSVTIDLATRKQTIYMPNDLGLPANAKAARDPLRRAGDEGREEGKENEKEGR